MPFVHYLFSNQKESIGEQTLFASALKPGGCRVYQPIVIYTRSSPASAREGQGTA